MEACLGVEQDLERALTKFRVLGEHSDRILNEAIQHIQNLNQELSEVPDQFTLTPAQVDIVQDNVERCRETLQRLAADHRDAHASVSRVGKAIDRHFVSVYGAVAPRAAQFSTEANRRLAERAITQHLYRQGLEEAGDALAAEASLHEEAARGEPFAALQRIATALAEGDAGPALDWTESHKDRLKDSPLAFALHRLAFLQIARRDGAGAAVRYARDHFPQFAARHERELQRAMCLLAYTAAGASPPPTYSSLRDESTLATDAAELFIKEACALLRLPPLSPLAAAVLAGARVLPALLEIRAKMSHPHVAAAWGAKDELPVEVDLGGEGGGHHSVFACPILRQQASEQNPPMRLLCGHVISRDALTKLAQGVKLKCPYCPMEQSPLEARLIYF